MYCPNCGENNKDESKFCTACGCRLIKGSPDTDQSSITAYAGFWLRFLASIIDSIILGIVGGIIGGSIGGVLGSFMGALGTSMETIKLACFALGYILGMILNWLYFTIQESSSAQATLGKKAVGIFVTDIKGRRISFNRANGRYWGKCISALIMMIGYIMAGFTEKKQALHDSMANTVVLKK